MVNIYWGDLHNHNELGYGKGRMERSFDIAESSLDFYAFTPHTWWPDVPENDPVARDFHLAGFEKVKKNWEKIKSTVHERHQEEKFVTILAWEWHSLKWGDYCMYHQNPDDDFYYADSLEDLKKYSKEKGAFIIPHHTGYEEGMRGLNWREFDSSFSPVVEIFSEHGNSLECDTHKGMYGHSMGGMEYAQSGLIQMERGKRFGVIACTDNHYGYPGCYTEGLTAVIAEELNRDQIFNAIQKRHTYAVTGDRIKLDFKVNGQIMGSEIPFDSSVDIDLTVEARDPLQCVELYKNSKIFKTWTELDLENCSDNKDLHLQRLEWGWDMIASKIVTEWQIELSLEDGQFELLEPSFCGGGGSIELINKIHEYSAKHIKLESFTHRKNTLPVNSISSFWRGGMDSKMNVEVRGKNGDTGFFKEFSVLKKDVLDNSFQESMFDRFSCPKIRVNRLISPQYIKFQKHVSDNCVKRGDYYHLKVIQKNGQMAWSSPIWLGKS